MRGRDGGRVVGGNAATDLLVCFPPRTHLSLMPKPICSPARPMEQAKRHGSRSCNRGQASPLFRVKPKPSGGSEISEPTSPKVTCAGQIKVKPKSGGPCKNWESVMEEIERLHNSRRVRKKPNWMEALGLKKDIMQFLTCLRGLRFDMRCFGSFHGSVLDDSDSCDEDDEDNEEEEGQETDMGTAGSEASRTIFSKWFMILQENQNHGLVKETEEREEERDEPSAESSVPPKNALLLMRCRSAPAKGWLKNREGEEEEEQQEQEQEQHEKEEEEEKQSTPPMSCKDKEKKLLLMRYEPDFFKVSTDIAKETWVVGKTDPFSRSRSWKR
ncbi:hypothetical protein H6P81_011529 [Aristolochia fimbriata]|uniref:Uncharacterized protein n=1 Tax=Aristolochia fimbriata TaxID=158543 RepID=A0AAV7ESM7_ARIFI|nr:hypothetical protein H6P81_011529 [Aristolochia fimbriata]